MQKFRETLNYASCNEDWRAEWEALAIKPDDTVLCVTGSGDRPLDLLPQNPKRMIAFDRNPIQNYLLQLKMAAMTALPYEEYVRFLGLKSTDSRMEIWQRVRGILSADCAGFWERNLEILIGGIIYQGRWERHFHKIASIAKIVRGSAIRQLFQFGDIKEQRKFVETQWDRWWWRLFFRLIFNPTFSRVFFGDPGFYEFVPRDAKIGGYIFDRLKTFLSDNLARESFMVHLALTGRLGLDDLPPYLHPEETARIASKLGRLEIVAGDVVDVMNDFQPGAISKFSLSDVPSFLDQVAFERMLDAMVACAAPEARFCIRMFLTNQSIPSRFDGILVRDRELERRLRLTDRSIAYQFLVGTIHTSR